MIPFVIDNDELLAGVPIQLLDESRAKLLDITTAYLSHKEIIGPHNRSDHLQPYADIVVSSSFTGLDPTTNRELTIVHRAFRTEEEATRTTARQQVRGRCARIA